jgi:hypothetical protein
MSAVNCRKSCSMSANDVRTVIAPADRLVGVSEPDRGTHQEQAGGGLTVDVPDDAQHLRRQGGQIGHLRGAAHAWMTSRCDIFPAVSAVSSVLLPAGAGSSGGLVTDVINPPR